MPNNLKTLRQRGDTIVEVMIVLAVLGMAISISYATANRSLLNARQAQENGEATALAQSQIEALRVLSAKSKEDANRNIYAQTNTFCVRDTTVVAPILPSIPVTNCEFSNIPYTILIYNCDSISALTPTAPCDTPNIVGTNTFIVQATWPNVHGHGQDSVTLNYRIHNE